MGGHQSGWRGPYDAAMRSRSWDAMVGAVTVSLLVAAASCSDDESGSGGTLPPIITTTSTSTTMGPTTTFSSLYEVQPGDTLTAIAESVGVPIAELMRANGITDPNSIQAGQMLRLPLEDLTGTQPAGASTTTTASVP